MVSSSGKEGKKSRGGSEDNTDFTGAKIVLTEAASKQQVACVFVKFRKRIMEEESDKGKEIDTAYQYEGIDINSKMVIMDSIKFEDDMDAVSYFMNGQHFRFMITDRRKFLTHQECQYEQVVGKFDTQDYELFIQTKKVGMGNMSTGNQSSMVNGDSKTNNGTILTPNDPNGSQDPSDKSLAMELAKIEAGKNEPADNPSPRQVRSGQENSRQIKKDTPFDEFKWNIKKRKAPAEPPSNPPLKNKLLFLFKTGI